LIRTLVFLSLIAALVSLLIAVVVVAFLIEDTLWIIVAFNGAAGFLIALLGGRSEKRGESASFYVGPVLLTQLAAVAVVLQVTGWSSPVPPLVVLAFVCIGPGWAILRLWDLARGWAGVGLAVAVSLSLAIIVPGVLLYAGAWSPLAALVILAGVTVLASIATVAHPSRLRVMGIGEDHPGGHRDPRGP
jgi:hypothetical protein